MTEEIAAAPGWVDDRLDTLFAALPQTPAITTARHAYADCIAAQKAPAAPSDLLGAEFETCTAALRRNLQAANVPPDATTHLMTQLEALEAELARDS